MQLVGVHPENGLTLRDEAFPGHFHGDAHRGSACPIRGARLQQVQLAPLHGELDVLHVPVVRLELAGRVLQRGKGRGQVLRHARNGLRVAGPGHHVLALGVHQKLAVQPFLTGGWVPRERDPGARVLAEVSVDHRDYAHGRTEVVGNAMMTAVLDGTPGLPAPEHRLDSPPELVPGILRERPAGPMPHDLLELMHERAQPIDAEIDLAKRAGVPLGILKHGLKGIRLTVAAFDPEYHVGIHLHEPAIRVKGKGGVPALHGQGVGGRVREPKIEDGIHHAGHGHRRAGPDRDEQRIGSRAERSAGDRLEPVEGGAHFRHHLAFEALVTEVRHTQRRRQGESRRHWNSEVGHFGEAGPLAAQHVFHARVPVRRSIPEEIDRWHQHAPGDAVSESSGIGVG